MSFPILEFKGDFDSTGTEPNIDTRTRYHSTSNQIVLAYGQDGGGGTNIDLRVVIPTISGDTLTFNTSTNIRNNQQRPVRVDMWDDTNSGHMGLIEAGGTGASPSTTARALSISGTTITANAALTMSTQGAYVASDYSSVDNRAVAVYRDDSPTGTAAAVLTITGTTMSSGTPVQVDTTAHNICAVTYDDNVDKFLISWTDLAGTFIKSVVATMSGTSLTFGTTNSWGTGLLRGLRHIYDPLLNRHLIVYLDDATSFVKCRVATISGTTVSVSAEVDVLPFPVFDFSAGNFRNYINGTYDITNEMIWISTISGNESLGFSQPIVIGGRINTITGLMEFNYGGPYTAMNAGTQSSAVEFNVSENRLGVFSGLADTFSPAQTGGISAKLTTVTLGSGAGGLTGLEDVFRQKGKPFGYDL